MSSQSEIGHSSYMISKAAARIRTQKRLVSIARVAADQSFPVGNIKTLEMMEERLAILFRQHQRLLQETYQEQDAN